MTEVEQTPQDVTPKIFAAAEAGDADELTSVIGSDPSCATALNKNNRSALSLAAARGHLKCVKLLLEAGATDSSAAGWTAVHHAAFGGHVEVLGALVAKLGAPAATSGGIPPLLLAAARGNVACLTLLLDAAPDALNACTDAHGRTALMLAASGGSAAAVELLAERGAELNATSVDGKTALMWAVVSNKPAAVAALARLGADDQVAAPLGEAIIPGQDRSKGETAHDMADARHAKDPTLRHISKYMAEWRKQKTAQPDACAPEMPPLPWVSHAEDFAAKEAAKEAAEAAEASKKADEPAITELGADDANDIFGDVAASDDAVPVGGDDDAALKQAAEEEQRASIAELADLDELD